MPARLFAFRFRCVCKKKPRSRHTTQVVVDTYGCVLVKYIASRSRSPAAAPLPHTFAVVICGAWEGGR